LKWIYPGGGGFKVALDITEVSAKPNENFISASLACDSEIIVVCKLNGRPLKVTQLLGLSTWLRFLESAGKITIFLGLFWV